MKKTFNIIGAAVLGASVLFGAASCANSQNDSEQKAAVVAVSEGAIVYIDMTKIMNEYQMAIDLANEANAKIEELTKALDNKAKTAEKEITKKQSKFQTKYNEFMDKYSKGHLTETTANVRREELQKLENEYNTYYSQKMQELEQEEYALQSTAAGLRLEMNNAVNGAINKFIKKYNEEKRFAMILISVGDDENDEVTVLGNPVLLADPSLDITAEVLEELNAEYNASK